MFFRRHKPRQLSFDDYLNNLRQFGFEVQTEGSRRVKAARRGFAAYVEDAPDGPHPKAGDPGLVVGNQLAYLVDGGFQKFFITEDGKRIPAVAAHLRTLHDFTEDLKEALGISSLYNEGLGTTFERHLYDRVKDRDRGVPMRPWESHRPEAG